MTTNITADLKITDQAFLAARPKALYRSEQVYAIEKAWFEAGYDSFALMQQAAWQMAQIIITHAQQHAPILESHCALASRALSAAVWTGSGNNGGDGWLIAHYLQAAGWQVTVVDVGEIDPKADSDAARARRIATQQEAGIYVISLSMLQARPELQAQYHIDALFGIGFDRQPVGRFADAIERFNQVVAEDQAIAVAVDIPSGVVASTGHVFSDCAIKADITLCLVATKLGLTIKDGLDFSGEVIDIPLIPYLNMPSPSAWQLKHALPLSARHNNSHKGSYGHVMIIGGNQSCRSQGMGGAAIMAAGSALASGAGKVTVACHTSFHGAVLATQPNAMTVDLYESNAVDHLIQGADVIAIGMGFGRDDKAKALFVHYLDTAIKHNKPMVIDADGLYHLATLMSDNDTIVDRLITHSAGSQVCFTPHSGEAARLLNCDSKHIEQDRLKAIYQCEQALGGEWLLKGPGSLVLSYGNCYVCSAGNPGMATAGMGDILAGLIAGLMAQSDLPSHQRSLYQAVMIHAMAADLKAGVTSIESLRSAGSRRAIPRHRLSDSEQSARYLWPDQAYKDLPLLPTGTRGLQAQDMVTAIGIVMNILTDWPRNHMSLSDGRGLS